MPEADTDAEARRVQLEAYRAMGGIARLRLGFALSEEVRRLALAGSQDRTATQR